MDSDKSEGTLFIYLFCFGVGGMGGHAPFFLYLNKIWKRYT